ncbi:MAG: 4-(cytidine 5'-diphospho)-2-C-methyl-D-erythritol kinase [Xanthobacteraceae bacterium]|nr:4-(cytidine 5'-diphospho)-2-C-methyl-D-erythritol kinase [Xanthobacteraceae bacterium]
MPAARAERAPAKINLTLRVVGRRADGYHELESLVVFAGVGDTLTFTPGRALALTVDGPTAAASGSIDDNLVVKAARALAERVENLKLGRFMLVKRLPVAAGIGGGSSDAAAALRLIARANRIALDDPRLMEAARVSGADVPVCLVPRPRLMRGIGEILSEPLALPKLPAVLVNPRVAVPTRDVFAALRAPLEARGGPTRGADFEARRRWKATDLVETLAGEPNDLEAPAIALAPAIAQVLSDLRALRGCRLARMSGSGATCFALFATAPAAAAAARALRGRHPAWWVRATKLG